MALQLRQREASFKNGGKKRQVLRFKAKKQSLDLRPKDPISVDTGVR